MPQAARRASHMDVASHAGQFVAGTRMCLRRTPASAREPAAHGWTKGVFAGCPFFTPGILPSALRAGFAVLARSRRASGPPFFGHAKKGGTPAWDAGGERHGRRICKVERGREPSPALRAPSPEGRGKRRSVRRPPSAWESRYWCARCGCRHRHKRAAACAARLRPRSATRTRR